MKDSIHDYDGERDFYSMPPGCWFWLGVLVAIAITVGVLWWFNS